MVEARTFMISLLVFSGVITGMTLFYGELFNNYGYTSQDISSLSASEELVTQAKEIETTVRTSVTRIPVVDEAIAYISAGLKSLSLIFNTVNVAQNTLIALSDILKLPGWITDIILGIMSILIIFIVISAYLRYKV